MSNEGTDKLVDFIVDEVDKLWVLKDRDDLKDDCMQYVYDNYDYETVQLGLGIEGLVIAFLSDKACQCISTADLESMARDEQETEITSYEEADQGM